MTIANDTRLDQRSRVAVATSLPHQSRSPCATLCAPRGYPEHARIGRGLSREQARLEARAAEARARQALALAIARAEETCALALRQLVQLEADLDAIHRHLRAAGYPG